MGLLVALAIQVGFLVDRFLWEFVVVRFVCIGAMLLTWFWVYGYLA